MKDQVTSIEQSRHLLELAADKLLGIQIIDKGCANAEYIIRLRQE